MPVDVSLSDEQRQIQELAREFARREIRPVAAGYDEADAKGEKEQGDEG